MVSKQLINKYAKALYAVALKNDVMKKTEKGLDLIYTTIKSIPELNHLLLSQRISKHNKKKVIAATLSDILGMTELELLMVLIDNNDVHLLKEIL